MANAGTSLSDVSVVPNSLKEAAAISGISGG
jgi:hypothetical protein